MQPLCKNLPEDLEAPWLAPGTVASVQPEYARVASGAAELESRLRGARLRLRPLPGMTSEELTRAVECHQARAALGEIAPSADDPYSLPGRWLDITASSARDSFVVVVVADDLEGAQRALDRARRFAALACCP